MALIRAHVDGDDEETHVRDEDSNVSPASSRMLMLFSPLMVLLWRFAPRSRFLSLVRC